MGAQRKYFSPEFKREAVRRAASGDATVLEVARELGIRSDRLREWMAQVKGTARRRAGPRGAEDAPAAGGPVLSLDEEVRQLRRENAQLQEERDILKKAAAFFARESR
jgi:transposase